MRGVFVVVGVLLGVGVFDGMKVGVGDNVRVGVGAVLVGVGLGAAAMILKLSVLALQEGSALWKTATLNTPGK